MSEDVNSAGFAEFRIIDPPRITPNPVFPNRLSLIPLVMLAALGAGLAASFAMAQRNPDFSCGGSAAGIHPKASPRERIVVGQMPDVSAPALSQCRFFGGLARYCWPMAHGLTWVSMSARVWGIDLNTIEQAASRLAQLRSAGVDAPAEAAPNPRIGRSKSMAQPRPRRASVEREFVTSSRRRRSGGSPR